MNRAVKAFIAIASTLAVALSLVVGMTGGHQSPLIGLGFVTMFVPTIAALVVGSAIREGLRIDWTRLPPAYLPVALFLIPLTLHVAMLSTVAVVGPLPWAEWLTPQADGFYHSPASRGWGVLTTPDLVARIATNAVVGLVVVSFLALFEEIGWRGWLLPRLMDRMGVRRAVLVTAILWAIWHVPFALSGIQHIDGMSSIRVAIAVPLGTVGAGLIIGWLWVRTESIWIVAFAHGAHNNWGQYAFKFMQDFAAPDPGLVLGAGIIGLSCVGTLLLIFGLSPRTALTATQTPKAQPL